MQTISRINTKSGAASQEAPNSRLSDEGAQELLGSFLEGDQEAFDRLIEAFSPMIYGIFLKWFRLSIEDAEDLFQETMLQMVVKAEKIRNVRAWLQGTAINQARKRIRTLIRDRELAKKVIDRAELCRMVGYDEDRDIVERGLRKLSPEERKLLRLFFVEGMSYQESAALLDRPIGSLGPMRARTLEKLSREIRRLEMSA